MRRTPRFLVFLTVIHVVAAIPSRGTETGEQHPFSAHDLELDDDPGR